MVKVGKLQRDYLYFRVYELDCFAIAYLCAITALSGVLIAALPLSCVRLLTVPRVPSADSYSLCN